jgi:hypothetical protein
MLIACIACGITILANKTTKENAACQTTMPSQCTTSVGSALTQESVTTGSKPAGTTSAHSTTTTSTTTTTTTSTTTTMVETVLTTEPPQEMTETEIVQTEYQEPVAYGSYNDYITDYEYVLLCNLVANEYGSDTHGYGGPPVTPYERACVVSVVMNRVSDAGYPNTIEGVVTQPCQFTGYYACPYYWDTVTQNVRDGVDYYFAHQDEFPYYLSFYGDGAYNHFS